MSGLADILKDSPVVGAPAAEHPHGFAGFIDRVFNPTNALGQFGQALVASSGGPLGNAMALLMQQHQQAGKDGRDFEAWKRQYDYEVAHPKPSSAGPHYWETNNGSLFKLDDTGNPVEVYHDPSPKMNFIPDGTGGGQWIAVPSTLPSTLPSGASSDPSAPPIGSIVDDPRKTAPSPRPIGGYDAFKRAIIKQETGGRYGVPNAEGSGAMGIGQVMPATTRALAGRLGLPYQPGLMSGTGPDARAYQDKITDAAVREAYDAGAGDPSTAAKYYFGGSDRSKWGPKTRRYASDILMRLGG